MSGFKTDKSQKQSQETNARQEKPRNDRREDRRDNDRRDERREEAYESQYVNQWQSVSEQGRASQFHTEYKEMLKTNNFSADVSELFPVTGELSNYLAGDRGYLVYGSRINNEVFYHLLILETGTGIVVTKPSRYGRDRDRDRDRDRRDTKRILSTMDGVTDQIIEKLDVYVRRVFKVESVVFTGPTIYPAKVEINPQNVSSYLASMEDANFVYANVDRPFNVNDEIKKGTTVRGNLRYSSDNVITNSTGVVVRGEFNVQVETHSRDRSDNPLVRQNSEREFVSMDLMVQPRYIGFEEDVRRLKAGDKYNMECCIPEITVTNVELNAAMDYGKYERLFLGIGMLPNMNTNQYWMRKFETFMHSKDDMDRTTALSGIAYMMDWPEDVVPTDLEKIDATPSAKQSWVNQVFRIDDGAEYSMLIHEGSLGYAIQRILIDLGEGSMDAFDMVCDLLDNLTDGKFDDLRRATRPEDMVYKVVRIPCGEFSTGTERLPSEFVDTLFVANVLNNDLRAVDDFDALTAGREIGLNYDESMTRLCEIIDDATGRSFQQTGFVSKVYFTPEFLEDLYAALQKSKLAVDVDHDDLGSDRRRRRNYDVRLLRNDVARRDNRRGSEDRDNRGYTPKYSRR